MFTVPNASREEWKKLVRGDLKHTFQNYVLQMKVHQTVQDVKNGKVNETVAVESIHSLCEKYALAVQNDLKSIFKTW